MTAFHRGGDQSKTARASAVVALLVIGASLCGPTGCVSVRTSHGYILERGETALTAREGVDTKESVLAKYGEPSIKGAFDNNHWYYLASRDAARAFFRPQLTRQQVVAFHFDENGVVTSVEDLNLEQSVPLKVVSRTTPTRGKELGFWEQLLGNVGQLPAGALGGAGPQGPN